MIDYSKIIFKLRLWTGTLQKLMDDILKFHYEMIKQHCSVDHTEKIQ